jgi:hypothetical protein
MCFVGQNEGDPSPGVEDVEFISYEERAVPIAVVTVDTFGATLR